MASGVPQCRLIDSVEGSTKSMQENSARGGHVWKHIAYLGSKPTKVGRMESQLGKTMFASEKDFLKAWKAYKTMPLGNPTKCGVKKDGQKFNDCVYAKDVEITKAYVCKV